eukprot:gene8125-biopygen16605
MGLCGNNRNNTTLSRSALPGPDNKTGEALPEDTHRNWEGDAALQMRGWAEDVALRASPGTKKYVILFWRHRRR